MWLDAHPDWYMPSFTCGSPDAVLVSEPLVFGSKSIACVRACVRVCDKGMREGSIDWMTAVVASVEACGRLRLYPAKDLSASIPGLLASMLAIHVQQAW